MALLRRAIRRLRFSRTYAGIANPVWLVVDGRIALALGVILALILGGSALGLPALIAYRRKSAAAREALATARREDEAKLRVERARFDALEMIHRRCEEAERNILQSSEPAAIARILCDATGNLLGRSTVFLGYDAATSQIKPIHTFGADARVRPVHLSSSARERIRDAEKDNRVINLGDYPALQEQMIAAYDVGHFDAWVVAGRGMFSRYEDAPSVLGVLIVLSPDASSHEKTGSLLRLLRSGWRSRAAVGKILVTVPDIRGHSWLARPSRIVTKENLADSSLIIKLLTHRIS